jgi:hypothetical protein
MPDIEKELVWVARNGLGIYPAAVGDVPRTEWQDGWNKAVMRMVEYVGIIHEWYKTITEEQAAALVKLLKAHVLFFTMWGGKVEYFVNLNDTFDYASADGEDVTVEEFTFLVDLYEKFGHHGITAWAALRRVDVPIKERMTEEYHNAVRYIMNSRPV